MRIGMESQILYISAITIAFTHTLLGPDHYLPFIMISKARNWSLYKTIKVTLLCGVGHVVGSIVLGALGIFLAIALFELEYIESLRGDIASWGLILFGLIYFIWGLKKISRKKHNHSDLLNKNSKKAITPWALFVIFVLGPCEALIPLLMYPAAKNNMFDVAVVTILFSVITVLTMSVVVYLSTIGLSRFRFGAMERYMHAFSGFIILFSGLSIKFLGL